MVRFSIRNRLLALFVLILISLLFLNNALGDSQTVLEDLEQQAEDFLERDATTIALASSVSELAETLFEFQKEAFLPTYIPHDEGVDYGRTEKSDKDAMQDNFNIYKDRYEELIDNLDVRENGLIVDNQVFVVPIYDFQTPETGIALSFTDPVKQSTIDSLNQIVDTSEAGAFNSTVDREFSLVTALGTSVDSVSNTLTLRNAEMINSYEASIELIGILNDTLQLETDLNNNLTPKNATYNVFVTNLFLPIFSDLGKLALAHSSMQSDMLGSNLHNPITLTESLEQFETTSLNLFNSINNTISGISLTTLDSSEISILSQINSTIISELDPLNEAGVVFDFVDQTDDVFNLHRDIIRRFEDDFGLFGSTIDTNIEEIQNIVRLENEQFIVEFEKFREETREAIENFIQQVSLAVVLVILGAGFLIIIRLRGSLNRLERNFKEVIDGKITVLDRRSYQNTELGVVEEGFDQMVNNLADILGTVQTTSERLAGIAEMLVAGTEEASASINSVSDTISSISAGASEQNILISRVADKLQDHLLDVRSASGQISEASYFVLKVAQRTNILGLNASIEAAKSKELGKGFNVVAREVRELSNDTKASANEIADMIDRISYSIRNTVEDVMKEVEIVREVAENTAAGSEEANASSSEQVILLNEISETANELSSLANNLNEAIQTFNLVYPKGYKKGETERQQFQTKFK